MSKALPYNAHRVQGVKVSPWTPVPGAKYCSMRFVEGTDPKNVANRVAFIEKTPRVRAQPFSDVPDDCHNWHYGYKGDGGWDKDSQGWCDAQLLALGYLVSDPKPCDPDLLASTPFEAAPPPQEKLTKTESPYIFRRG